MIHRPNQIRFAVSAEFECDFVDPNDTGRLSELAEQGYGEIVFGGGAPLPSQADVAERISEIKGEAKKYQKKHLLKAHHPSNLYEQKVYDTWQRTDVDSWGAAECLNYALYDAHSTPQLGKPHIPLDAPYSTVVDSKRSMLEYRFGSGVHQTGYFDFSEMKDGKPQGISEIRTNPVGLEFFPLRYNITTQQIGAAAWYLGQRAFLLGTHFTCSFFKGERPILGDMETNIEPYKAALGGLLRANREQALIHSGAILAKRPHSFYASPWRDGMLRIVPGKFEYRVADQPGAASNAMALRFITSGIRYGLMHPETATKENVKQIEHIHPRITEAYNPEADDDIELLRAIESCRIDPSTRTLQLVRELEAVDLPKFVQGLVGRKPNTENQTLLALRSAVADFVHTCIAVGIDGTLILRQGSFLESVLRGRFEILDINGRDRAAIMKQFQKVRVSENRKSIEGEVIHAPLEIDEIIEKAQGATVLPNIDQTAHHQHLQELHALRDALQK